MADSRKAKWFLTAVFGVIISGVAIIQAAVELRQGEGIQALDLFRQMPNQKNLRRFEKELEKVSVFAQQARVPMQRYQFTMLRDTGEKAIMGNEGWFFYKPGMRFLVEPWPPRSGGGASQVIGGSSADETGHSDPLSVITGFKEALEERGIRLLVVPAPGKASVYPDRLSSRVREALPLRNTHTQKFIAQLEEAGVEVVDLLARFAQARDKNPSEQLYLERDTHWTPAGMQLAVDTVAQRLLDPGWISRGNTSWTLKEVKVTRPGDVVEMMGMPEAAAKYPGEEVTCTQVVDKEDGQLFKPVEDAEILVLGDSFMRIYERDEPESAGFIAHLAAALQQPVSAIINDGGASTLVRQTLNRKPELLSGKRVVVWEFVERDLRFGTEGWQHVPLPDKLPAEQMP